LGIETGENRMSRKTATTALVVGAWTALTAPHESCGSHGTRFVSASDLPTELRDQVMRTTPDWLVIGEAEEETVESAVAIARTVDPSLRIAMLGPVGDERRCERWLRRGCTVYLAYDSGLSKVANVLTVATEESCNVYDARLQTGVVDSVFRASASLTARQGEVLDLLCRGLTNSQIARFLHVSQTTVEFHVRHIREKLGAKNRVETVKRAIAMGLW
jgi:DNA-binding NarL/FixJ family response regulator